MCSDKWSPQLQSVIVTSARQSCYRFTTLSRLFLSKLSIIRPVHTLAVTGDYTQTVALSLCNDPTILKLYEIISFLRHFQKCVFPFAFSHFPLALFSPKKATDRKNQRTLVARIKRCFDCAMPFPNLCF